MQVLSIWTGLQFCHLVKSLVLLEKNTNILATFSLLSLKLDYSEVLLLEIKVPVAAI